MRRFEEAEIIAGLELISRTTPSQQAIERAIERVRISLRGGMRAEEAGPSLQQIVCRSKAMRLAAAAVLIIAALAGAVCLWNRAVTRPSSPGGQARQKDGGQVVKEVGEKQQGAEQAAVESPAGAEAIKAELARVERGYAAKDIAGLTAMLANDSMQVRVAAANYLALIGDINAVGALEKAGSRWQGQGENPFDAAIEAIKTADQNVPQTSGAAGGPAVLKMERSQVVLSGKITDANTGEPVTDAEVELQGGPWQSSKTDANGFYCFEQEGFGGHWGDFRIGIFTNEYKGITRYSERPVIHLEQNSRVVKDFKLTRACMIEMRVVDEDGKPIEQARLTAASMASRYGSGGERFIYTDSNGIALMGGFEPSGIEYLITASHSRRTWVNNEWGGSSPEETYDYAPGHITVKLNTPDVVECGEIVLKKGVEVKGYAEYSDGAPAVNVKLMAYPEWWRGSEHSEGFAVDANGYFAFSNIEAGNHRIMARIPRGRGFLQQDVAWQILPPAEGELLKVIIPEKSDRSTVSITGKVRFVGSGRTDFVEIEAYSPLRAPQSGRSFTHSPFQDANEANFIVDKLEPGIYRLKFFGLGIEEKVIEGVESPSEGLVVELARVGRPRLKGTVVDAQTKKPIDGFRARLRKIKTLRGPNYWPNESWFDVTSATRQFDIETDGPGVYQVQIAADGFAPKWSSEINTDQNTPVIVELTKGGSIRGVVVDEQARPISGARVMALSKAGDARGEIFVSEEGAVETIDGRFQLNNIPAGSETLRAVHRDYAFTIEHDIAVQEGQVTDVVRIVMRKGGIVEGYVYDANGRGQPYVVLCFQDIDSKTSHPDSSRNLATAITDTNGFYHVSGLPEQLCFVSRQDIWRTLGVVCRAVVPESGKVSRLDFGGQVKVKGRIVLDGRPLSNTKVQVSLVDDPYMTTYQNFAMTDGNGGFLFYGVPKGKWAIYYEQKEWQNNKWLKGTTIDVGSQDLDVGVVQPDVDTVTVSVSIEYEDGAANWNVAGLYVLTGERWGQAVGDVIAPTAPGQPHIVKHVPAGTHKIVLMRRDNVAMLEPIEVGSEDLHVTVRIPACTANVSGRMAGGPGAYRALWRSDTKIGAGMQADGQGNYSVKNLPAGHYLVGDNSLNPESVILEFDLAASETKTVDIDVNNAPKATTGGLSMLLVDENGVPAGGAEIWLEKAGQRIEAASNRNGTAYFTAAPDTYTLNVRLAGYRQVIREVTVPDRSKAKTPAEPLIVRLERQ